MKYSKSLSSAESDSKSLSSKGNAAPSITGKNRQGKLGFSHSWFSKEVDYIEGKFPSFDPTLKQVFRPQPFVYSRQRIMDEATKVGVQGSSRLSETSRRQAMENTVCHTENGYMSDNMEVFCTILNPLIQSVEQTDQNRKRRALKTIIFYSQTIMNALCDLVKTEENETQEMALEALHSLASYGADMLLESTQTNLDLVSTFAAQKTTWPLNITSEYKGQENPDEYVKKIRLGADKFTNKNGPGKRVSLRSGTIGEYANELIYYIELVRASSPNQDIKSKAVYPFHAESYLEIKSLGDFNEASCDEWFEVAWNLLLYVTENKPQDVAALVPFGQSRERYADTRVTTSERASDQHRESYRKDGIRKALKQTFKSLAKERI